MSQWVQFRCTCYQPKAHSLNEKLVSASLDNFIYSYSYEKNANYSNILYNRSQQAES